jgi:hypothetical protein
MNDLIAYYRLCGFESSDVAVWLNISEAEAWQHYSKISVHIYSGGHDYGFILPY